MSQYDISEILLLALGSTGNQKKPLFEFLSIEGDGTGLHDANGNYVTSGTEIFYLQPPAGEIYRISRMMVTVEDSTGMQAQEYGNLGNALAEGVVVRVQDDSGLKLNITNGFPVKTNAEWAKYCFDVELKTWGAGDELLAVRWTFLKTGQFIRLDGDKNERIEVVLSDNLAGLVHHFFHVQGYKETTEQ